MINDHNIDHTYDNSSCSPYQREAVPPHRRPTTSPNPAAELEGTARQLD